MILLTGSTGMIGRNLKELLPFEMLAPTKDELDLIDSRAVRDYLDRYRPSKIIHCGSNDNDICLYDNLRMFVNLADSGIPMITFCTGREVEDRSYKNGEYVFSKYLIKELALYKYTHIAVIQLWGCFGKYERPIRFFRENMARIKEGLPILVRADKVFGYVYIKDLVDIISGMDASRKVVKIVAYICALSAYGECLKEVTGSPYPVVIEDSATSAPYFGINDCDFEYTPLEEAIADYWREFNAEGNNGEAGV